MKIKNQYEQDGYLVTVYEDKKTKESVYKQDLFNAQVINKLDYIECLLKLNRMKGANL